MTGPRRLTNRLAQADPAGNSRLLVKITGRSSLSRCGLAWFVSLLDFSAHVLCFCATDALQRPSPGSAECCSDILGPWFAIDLDFATTLPAGDVVDFHVLDL